MYLGITINTTKLPENTNIFNFKFEKYGSIGIIYARKSSDKTDLLLQSHELESIKSYIRRLPIEIYTLLNDDFGIHYEDE